MLHVNYIKLGIFKRQKSEKIEQGFKVSWFQGFRFQGFKVSGFKVSRFQVAGFRLASRLVWWGMAGNWASGCKHSRCHSFFVAYAAG